MEYNAPRFRCTLPTNANAPSGKPSFSLNIANTVSFTHRLGSHIEYFISFVINSMIL